jgi:hypothetical protein
MKPFFLVSIHLSAISLKSKIVNCMSPSIDPWNYKPWWCQPWSIVLTGILLISGSWLLFHRVWLTGIVAIPVLTWMGFFLWVWPSLVVRSGILEDYPSDSNK